MWPMAFYILGICMIYVQEKNILDGYNCATFDDGCPDMFYQSDETFKCKFILLPPSVYYCICC